MPFFRVGESYALRGTQWMASFDEWKLNYWSGCRAKWHPHKNDVVAVVTDDEAHLACCDGSFLGSGCQTNGFGTFSHRRMFDRSSRWIAVRNYNLTFDRFPIFSIHISIQFRFNFDSTRFRLQLRNPCPEIVALFCVCDFVCFRDSDDDCLPLALASNCQCAKAKSKGNKFASNLWERAKERVPPCTCTVSRPSVSHWVCQVSTAIRLAWGINPPTIWLECA